jgi:acyl-CoA thioesterase FadM
MMFEQQIRRDSAQGAVLINARLRVACVDAARFRPRRLPDFVLEAIE